MIAQPQHLGDWRSAMKKARDFVHKAFPRELSPSRMLEKVASDSKKKNAARLTKVQTESLASNAAADLATQTRIAQLQAQTAPVGIALPQAPASAPPAKAKETDFTSYGLLAALLLGGVLIYRMKNK